MLELCQAATLLNILLKGALIETLKPINPNDG